MILLTQGHVSICMHTVVRTETGCIGTTHKTNTEYAQWLQNYTILAFSPSTERCYMYSL